MCDRLTRLAVVSLLTVLPFAGCGGDKPKSGKKCADIVCANHQLCQEASGDKDAVCLAECETGFVWNGDTSACDPLATCTSLDCESQGRICNNNPDGAVCGDCLADYRLDGSDCVEITSCESLPAQGTSILNLCAAQGRECVEAVVGEAECGDCLQASHVVDPDSGVCRAPLTCYDITCTSPLICNQYAGQDAFCDPNCQGPNGEPGIPNPQGVCILCPPCDDTAHGEAGPYTAALTGEGRCICETASGYYWQEGEPTGVTPCDRDGDGWVRFSAKAARDATSEVIRGRAHCDFREIEAVVLHGERWTRTHEARDSHRIELNPSVVLYESDRNDDVDILAQALATSNRIAVFPTSDTTSCTIDSECPANHICRVSSGKCVRPPKPEELNSLTKYCVSELGDFNHNEIEDIEEWHESTDTVHAVYQPLLEFTYFAELHRGWFEFNSTSGNVYHIAEKSRRDLVAAGWKVPFVRPVDGNDYWRSCPRLVDDEYVSSGRTENFQGLDFAYAFGEDDGTGAGAFTGMTHHSQFKCHKIVNSVSVDAPANYITKDRLDNDPQCRSAFYNCEPTVNSCVALGTSGPDGTWNAYNPSSADMTCSVQGSAPTAPAIVWVAYGFYQYPDSQVVPPRPGYLRGCADECFETIGTCPTCDQARDTCPGSDLAGADCEGSATNYGELKCGCGRNWGGADCDFVCIDENVMTSPGFEVNDRQGYWMCGEPAGTLYVNVDSSGALPDAEQNWFMGDNYLLQGSIPGSRSTGEPACQVSDCSSGFVIR